MRLYVPDPAAEGARSQLLAAASRWPDAELQSLPLDPEWRERWKQWFHGFSVSPRLAVRPPWEPESGAPAEVVIEPGMAFGTGQHETTRLCLELVDERCAGGPPPRALLDVGCGTGILAIAAALLGVERVDGVDIDPDAVRWATENVERNRVGGRVTLSTTPLAEVTGAYPLVIANILAHILVPMADELAARVAPGGELVLCGVGREQAVDVRRAFEATGRLRWEGEATLGSWVRSTWRRVV